MQNLVAVITKKKGDKNGHGRDTVLTVYDMGKSYTMMIAEALAQLEAHAATIEGDSADINQAVSEQRTAWAKSIAGGATGNSALGWAEATTHEGIKAIRHTRTQKVYIQGYAVGSKTIEWDSNRPAEKKTRGSRNGVTAAKKELRKLAAQWRMSGINDESIIYTGETAKSLLEAIQA